MKFGDLLNHGQTKTGACSGAGWINLIKTLENMFLLFFGNANAVIFHRKRERSAFRCTGVIRMQTNQDMAVFFSVPVCIGDQIGHKTTEQLGITINIDLRLDICS